MRATTLPVLLLATAALAGAAVAEGLREIFYVPFEDSPKAVIARGEADPFQARVDKYEDGVKGKAARSERRYNGIRWDGRGNIDLDRGTLAIFYKPLYDPGVGEWDSLLGVSTDIEGYWASIIQFINKQDVNKQTTFNLHFFDVGRYSPVLKFPALYGRWKKDEWHHLAAVWDRNEGVTIYEDGRRVDSNWGRFRWDWNAAPRCLVLGEWIYSTKPFAVDEMHIYADCLTDAQVAQLARCETPTGEPIPVTPPDKRRDADLSRMGWAEDDLAGLPSVEPDAPTRFVFARIERADDARRQVAQPFEGLASSTWPLQKYGASTKGRQLFLTLTPGQSFDRVRAFSHRRFTGRFLEVLPGVGARPILEVDMPRPIWRGRFPSMRQDATLLLERSRGWLGQIDLFRVETASGPAGNVRMYPGCVKLDRMPPTLTGRAALGDTPARFDNPVRVATGRVEPWKYAAPAFGGFQVLSETFEDAVALDGVVLNLVAEGLTGPTPVQVVVKEPVFPQRDWMTAEALLRPKGPGRQVFTLHLKGRPVIPYPKTSLVTRKGSLPIEDPGRELAVLVTAANPVTWLMGEGGCSLGLCLTDLEKAKPVAVADQIEFAREAYAELNEGHIWDVIGHHGWGRLFYPLKWLLRFAPDERMTMELSLRVNWRQEPIPMPDRTPPAGAPEWAFWQMEAMRACLGIEHWIIDNRQTETGEFGGVWGDDTDMSEYWSDYALACDDTRKVTNALNRFWRGVYRDCLVEGVSRTIRDNLHSYEEGMGAICHEMLVNYGNPIAVEHAMRAASHYEPKWMKKNEDGTYSFRSNYLGYGGVYTEGAFGQDTGVNHLMLFPAAYLTWYNRHPSVTKYVLNWKRAPEAPGLVRDAYLRLRHEDDAERAAAYAALMEKTDPRGNPEAAIVIVDEIGMRDAWRDRLLQGAKANPWNFFAGKLPEYAGYSPRMTEYFWLAYRATGDMQYLVQSYRQACQFINNQTLLYTVAQPSTDRIPLPRTSVIRARIGALAVTRAGDGGCFWPRHGLSYVRGGEQVAALVFDNTERSLAARLYCFADKPHDLGLRVWRLDPGVYRVTLHHDRDNDGKPEEEILSREMDLERGASVDLPLPPRQGSILAFQAVRAAKPVYDLPDPAVCLEDVYLEYGDHLHVNVHNIGVQPVKDLVVRVSDGHTGAVVGERVIPHIPAPLDLLPKTELIEIQNVNAITKGSIVIELDPDRKHPDLNRFNNRVAFEY